MISQWVRTFGLAAALSMLVGCAPGGGGGGGNGDDNQNSNTAPNDNGNDNGTGGNDPTWQTVLTAPDASLLAVSGNSPTDVYVVGADDGNGSLFLHYDGTDWTRMDAGTSDALWWISAAPVDGLFFLSGDNGQIVRFNPDTGETELMTTPSNTFRVFGTWGSSADDVWAAISDVGNTSSGGQIWHYDGNANDEWVNVDLSHLVAAGEDGIPGLIKVFGRSASEVYAVGTRGTFLRYDGTAWSKLSGDAGENTRTLFSVHGDSENIAASGGSFTGVIVSLENEGDLVTTEINSQMNGIFFDSNRDFAVAIGIQEAVAFRENGVWTELGSAVTGLVDASIDFHGPWIDADGGVWATGGNLIGDPMDNGILVYYGTQNVPQDTIIAGVE